MILQILQNKRKLSTIFMFFAATKIKKNSDFVRGRPNRVAEILACWIFIRRFGRTTVFSSFFQIPHTLSTDRISPNLQFELSAPKQSSIIVSVPRD